MTKPYSTRRIRRLRCSKTLSKSMSCIICVTLTDFPEPSSVLLASMFFHFEPDNDFSIRCIINNDFYNNIQNSRFLIGSLQSSIVVQSTMSSCFQLLVLITKRTIRATPPLAKYQLIFREILQHNV
jgi:hypothetical protein